LFLLTGQFSDRIIAIWLKSWMRVFRVCQKDARACHRHSHQSTIAYGAGPVLLVDCLSVGEYKSLSDLIEKISVENVACSIPVESQQLILYGANT